MKYLVGLLLGGLMEDPEPRFGNPYLIVEAVKMILAIGLLKL